MLNSSKTTVAPSTSRQDLTKPLCVILWLSRGFLALAFLASGVMKLSDQPMMVTEFQHVGLGQWFRYLAGALEVLGAGLILVPRACGLGSLLITGIMAGAIFAHLTRLHTPPTAAVVLLILAGSVTWVYRAHVLNLVISLGLVRRRSVPLIPTVETVEGDAL